MPIKKSSYELAPALVASAAGGYLLAKERGVENIVPGDALWEALELARMNPTRMVSSLEGVQKFMELSALVDLKIVQLEDIDPKG